MQDQFGVTMLLHVQITDDGIRFGKQLTVSFHRTLRIPDDNRDYPLPPTFGRFPLARLGSASSAETAEAAIPIRNREALWIAFDGPSWRPNAVKVGLGAVNVVDGGAWHEPLHDGPQNYVVTDRQLWLDGVSIGDGRVRQFVATPLGEGLTVEEQVGSTRHGDIRIEVFEPLPGRFPDCAPAGSEKTQDARAMSMPPPVGIGVGGRIRQKVHADPHGIDTWDLSPAATVSIRLLDPAAFTQATGRTVPPTPIDAAAYARLGLPWFELYEADAREVAASTAFHDLKSAHADADETIDVNELRIRGLHREGN
jgi:hypothetical protein